MLEHVGVLHVAAVLVVKSIAIVNVTKRYVATCNMYFVFSSSLM